MARPAGPAAPARRRRRSPPPAPRVNPGARTQAFEERSGGRGRSAGDGPPREHGARRPPRQQGDLRLLVPRPTPAPMPWSASVPVRIRRGPALRRSAPRSAAASTGPTSAAGSPSPARLEAMPSRASAFLQAEGGAAAGERVRRAWPCSSHLRRGVRARPVTKRGPRDSRGRPAGGGHFLRLTHPELGVAFDSGRTNFLPVLDRGRDPGALPARGRQRWQRRRAGPDLQRGARPGGPVRGWWWTSSTWVSAGAFGVQRGRLRGDGGVALFAPGPQVTGRGGARRPGPEAAPGRKTDDRSTWSRTRARGSGWIASWRRRKRTSPVAVCRR
jgi:hypothetical protein